ncbi:hypothetical protein OAL49_03605 [Gammaproteobacteria bacterium]|nr:hypothetical protein [Gammaproteobacteria bacterium]
MQSVGRNRILEIVLFVIAALIAGITGLITVGVLFWLSDIQAGRDEEGKHGISDRLPSRLGGAAVLVSSLVVLASREFTNPSFTGPIWQHVSVAEIGALAIGFVGLTEDLLQSLGSIKRLLLLFLISGLCVALDPDLVPVDMVTWLAPDLMNQFWIMAPLTVVFVVAFVNAGNIADGANGLLPLILAPLFFVIYSLTGSSFAFAILLSVTVFASFNLLTGRVILGDAGSYLLSALACLWSLEIYGRQPVSAWFIAALLAYPCVELMISFVRRVWKRSSPMRADNHHLHNHLYAWWLGRGLPELGANSLTGVTIAFFTTGVALVFYFGGLSVDSSKWVWVFASEFALLLVTVWVLSFRNNSIDTKGLSGNG